MISNTFVELTSDKSEVLIGEPVLTRYERARIVGARALQVSQGAPVLIDVDPDDFQPLEVAALELRARVLPIGLQRANPNRNYQNIPIQWLSDREFIAQIRSELDEEFESDNGDSSKEKKTTKTSTTKSVKKSTKKTTKKKTA